MANRMAATGIGIALALLAIGPACKKGEDGSSAVPATGGEASSVAVAPGADTPTTPAAPETPCTLATFEGERDTLRLVRSLGRFEPPLGAMVEIASDAIFVNRRRAVPIAEESGVRTVPAEAKAGGRSSYLIEDLKQQLEAAREELEQSERTQNQLHPEKRRVLIVADAATPMRILKEVVYTAKEAGYVEFPLVVRRTAGARVANAEACTGFFGIVPLDIGRPADSAPRVVVPGGGISQQQLDDVQGRIESALSLENILGGGDATLPGIGDSFDVDPTGSGPHTTTGPTGSEPRGSVRPSPPTPAGGGGRMSADVVRAALGRKRGSIEACYNRAIAARPDLAGDLIFVIAIDTAGATTVTVEQDAAPLAAAGVTACVQQRLETLNFSGSPPQGGEFRVRLPLSFVPPEGGPAAPATTPAPEPPPETPVPAPPPPPPAPDRLGLVVVMTHGSLSLMVSREASTYVMPLDSPRIDIPHRSLAAADVEREAAAAGCGTPGGVSADCRDWDYLREWRTGCGGASGEAAQVPDLRRLNRELIGLAERVAALPGSLPDRWEITVKAEEDLPFCQVVAVADFARFRDPFFDWTADPEFAAKFAELSATRVPNPFWNPENWTDAIRAVLLFPILGLAN